MLGDVRTDIHGYYETLPMYKKASDVVVPLDRVVPGFPRYHKHTLGAGLRNI